MNATILSPSSLIDKVWHLTLLDNRFYHQLCRDLFPNATNIDDDFLIGHDPDGGNNLAERNIRYAQTLRLMEKYFHEKPDTLIWEPAESVSSKRPRDDADKTTDEELDEVISIRVVGTNEETTFKVKKTTKMKKIMLAYANRRGAAITSFHFLFEGRQCNPDWTPMMYCMEDNDIVDAMIPSAAC